MNRSFNSGRLNTSLSRALRLSLWVICFILSMGLQAQTLTRGEYFFDSDPGKGNATSLSFTQAASINKTFNININSLTTGTHTLNIRFVDNNGHWSLFNSKTFFIVNAASVVTATALKKAEYFFDTDPGIGKATALSISSGNPQSNTFVIGLGSLASGFHQLAIRYQDNAGRWSSFANRTFYIVPSAPTASSITLKKAEYFFDNDPGEGKGTGLPITAGNPQNNLFAINISSLTSGFHQLAIRYQDNNGKWSIFTNRTFYIVPTPSVAQATSIKKAEYFFDNDPGIGLGKPLPITTGNPQNNLFHIDISVLTSGFHQLAIRYQDNNGKWSVFTNRTFYIVPNASGASASSIKKAEYFFDTDPGVGKGTSYPITAGSPQNDVLAINISSLTSGFHQLCLRFQDNLGRWSAFSKRTFYIVPGTVMTKTIQELEYFIDTKPTKNPSAVGTPLSFTPAAVINQQFIIDLTNVPNGNHTLYFKAKDSQGYFSTVDSAKFSILNCTPPAAPTVPGVTVCNSTPATINATGASGTQVYRWYATASSPTILANGSSFVTPSLTKDSSYYTTIFDPTTTCESSRTLAKATVDIIPKPKLNLTGSLTVCSGNTEVLVAPSSFVSYSWSNGITGKDTIHVSTTGNYTVTVGDGICKSPPSDPFSFTVNQTPAKPIINATGGGTLCGGGTVSLSTTAGAGYTYSWSSGQTVNPLIVNSPGDFYVTITDANGCQSPPSNVFSVTTSAPAQPVIVVTGNTTLCNGDSVRLTAPNGFTHYSWSRGDTVQTIYAKVSANYTVTVSNGTCSSAPSAPISVTTVSVPTQPSVQITGTAVLCNNSFVGLSAPPGYSIYVWSDTETSRQIVVSQAGNYSVQVGNAINCLSVASSPVSVTLSGQPCGTGGGGNPNNTPPSIGEATINLAVGNEITFGLKSIITKGTIGIDFSTLRIAQPLGSGAKASIDANDNLVLDYTGNSFVGKENISIQVCDSLNDCTERALEIDVSADVVVFNAVSPFPDGINDFFNLKYIDQIEETKNNSVIIVDRWGNEVFSISNYNNTDRLFKGNDNSGKELPSGTYYYRIDFASGRPTLTGFISLKR